MKAQIEFIVILSLIIIAVGAFIVTSNIFVAEKESPELVGIGEETKLIKNSVVTSLSDLAKSELKEIYNTGGTSDKTITNGVKEIAVWKDCDGVSIPNLEISIKNGMEERINNIFKDNMDFFGKDVRFELNRLKVSCDIRDSDVKIIIDLPTYIDNAMAFSSYEILVQSELKSILDTTSEIIENNGNEDFFEAATLNTILFSNPEEKWLPTIDLKTGCRNTIFKSKAEIVDSMESVIKYTTSHTVFGKDIMDSAENPFYMIGVSDYNIDVSFTYPENWDLDSNFGMDPSPIIFYPEPIIQFSSQCIETVDAEYTFRYPVVVSIKDSKMGQLFNFALMVNINKNSPGCSSSITEETSYNDKCIKESECIGNVAVNDGDGKPLAGALVTFGECVLGETNYAGFLSSSIPCMIGEVSVRKEGYSVHEKLVKSTDLSSYSVSLEKKAGKIPVHFYGVPLAPGDSIAIGEYEDYTVSGQPRSIDLFSSDYFVLVYMKSDDGENAMANNVEGEKLSASSEILIGSGSFSVFAVAASSGSGITVGYIDDTYLSSGNEEEIYVYVPIVEGQTANSIKPSEISKIKATMEGCGIKAVSPGEQQISAPCG